MLNGYRVIDADSHVLEPTEMWSKYLEPEFRQFAPSPEMTISGEQIYYKITPEAGKKFRSDHERLIEQNYQHFLLNHANPESYVQVLNQTGVDMAFLYPTYGQWIWAIDSMPPALASAFTQAYNSWLKDYCSHNPAMLKGVGAISLHAPEEMVKQLHQVADYGWRAVYLRPNPVKGRLLSDPSYEPFWEECERLKIAVGLHEGTHSRLPTTGANRFSTRFALHACSHPMEQMMALLTLIEGGVLERYPNLKIGFLESGCGWLPYWLWRLDHVYEDVHWEVAKNIKMKPSEYFRRQCFVALEPYEPYLAEFVDYIGSDNLIFGSDYPHVDHKPTIVADTVALEEKLSKSIVEKILLHNPARFYGLDTI